MFFFQFSDGNAAAATTTYYSKTAALPALEYSVCLPQNIAVTRLRIEHLQICSNLVFVHLSVDFTVSCLPLSCQCGQNDENVK